MSDGIITESAQTSPGDQSLQIEALYRLKISTFSQQIRAPADINAPQLIAEKIITFLNRRI